MPFYSYLIEYKTKNPQGSLHRHYTTLRLFLKSSSSDIDSQEFPSVIEATLKDLSLGVGEAILAVTNYSKNYLFEEKKFIKNSFFLQM